MLKSALTVPKVEKGILFCDNVRGCVMRQRVSIDLNKEHVAEILVVSTKVVYNWEV